MTSGSTDRYLFIRARCLRCALPIPSVSEIMRPLALEPIASASASVLGRCVIRGEPTVVIDCGRLLGEHGEPKPQRYVALRVQGVHVVLAVEDVTGVGYLPTPSHALPPMLTDGAECVSELGDLGPALQRALGAARRLPHATIDHAQADVTP